MNITADIYGELETETANVMAQYPMVCPNRLAALRALRDGLATVLADDVVTEQISDPRTVARYAGLVQLIADEIAE